MKIENAVLENDGSLNDDVKKCLDTLYATVEGTCPMDRDFGISIDCVDNSVQVAKNMYALEVVEKTAKYEPRVVVKEVSFEIQDDMLIPHIKIEENEEEGEVLEDD